MKFHIPQLFVLPNELGPSSIAFFNAYPATTLDLDGCMKGILQKSNHASVMASQLGFEDYLEQIHGKWKPGTVLFVGQVDPLTILAAAFTTATFTNRHLAYDLWDEARALRNETFYRMPACDPQAWKHNYQRFLTGNVAYQDAGEAFGRFACRLYLFDLLREDVHDAVDRVIGLMADASFNDFLQVSDRYFKMVESGEFFVALYDADPRICIVTQRNISSPVHLDGRLLGFVQAPVVILAGSPKYEDTKYFYVVTQAGRYFDIEAGLKAVSRSCDVAWQRRALELTTEHQRLMAYKQPHEVASNISALLPMELAVASALPSMS